MSVFKKGDKIKRHTAPFNNAKVGEVYTALSDSHNGNVMLAEFPYAPAYDARMFTKVEEPLGKRFFGHKIKVTPETSEMIQKAVFEAGGERLTFEGNQNKVYLYIDKDGKIGHGWSEEFFLSYDSPELIVELEVVKSLKIVDVIPVKTPEQLQKEARLEQIKKLEEELAKLKSLE